MIFVLCVLDTLLVFDYIRFLASVLNLYCNDIKVRMSALGIERKAFLSASAKSLQGKPGPGRHGR
jgi:hypothetical protein